MAGDSSQPNQSAGTAIACQPGDRRGTPDRRAADAQWRADVQSSLSCGAERMSRIETELGNNTRETVAVKESTRELVDILNSFKGALKVLDFMGRLAKPIGLIVAAAGGLYVWLKTGTPPPPGGK